MAKREKDAKSDSSLSDIESGDEKVKSKKPKNDANMFDKDGRIDLTANKYVSVREFRGRKFVDIREFYEDKASGEMKPGKKGISLNSDQWRVLRSAVDAIDDKLKI